LLGEADLPLLELPSGNGDYCGQKKRAQNLQLSRISRGREGSAGQGRNGPM
jgi:hypothetical protein